ncbi:MAG: hypothetical protein ACP5NS_04800 [Candidatus Pacearchaeota archaeon]
MDSVETARQLTLTSLIKLMDEEAPKAYFTRDLIAKRVRALAYERLPTDSEGVLLSIAESFSEDNVLDALRLIEKEKKLDRVFINPALGYRFAS